jgi:glycosyltransferase involved in cell wall biosynthesis
MNPIKVLYLIEDFNIGGLERLVETIYNGLDRYKYDPHIWCLAEGGQLADKFALKNGKIRVLNLKSYHNLNNIIKLRYLIKKNDYKIIHTHGHFANTFGRISAFLANTPIIISHVHTTELNSKKRHKFIEKLLSMVTDKVICCSRAVRKFTIEHMHSNPARTITIYNGVYLPKKSNDHSFNDKINIVCVASLVSNKGHRYLFDAIKRLQDSGDTNFILNVVGGGPLKDELIEYSIRLGIDDKIIFWGIKKNVNDIMNCADICVLPTIEREGLGISLIEAMSHGKPVVGTKIGGIPEVIKDGVTGLLADPMNAKSLAKQLQKLIQDKKIRNMMGANGKKRFDRLFRAEIMLRNIESVYSKLLEKKSLNTTNILYLHNKMKISGGEQSLLNLWKNLNRDRFTLHLILPGPGPLEAKAKKNKLKVEFIKIPRWRPQSIFKLIVAFVKLTKYCRENRIKIIHSYTPRNNILSGIVGRLLKIRIIWHERNLIFGSEKDISKNFRFLSDCIICNSYAIAKRFKGKKGLPPNVKVIWNGVDTKKFHPDTSDGKSCLKIQNNGNKVVGLISNLGKRKMPEYFIETCPYVLSEHPNTTFVIVGGEFDDDDTGRLKELRRKTDSMGISDKILFTGHRNDIADIITCFDIGVSVTEKEACSRAILELMASGKPVVAFDTGGNSELIENDVSGKLLKFGDIVGLAKSISNILKDNERKDKMGKNARKLAKSNFDIKINTQKIEAIYLELAKL